MQKQYIPSVNRVLEILQRGKPVTSDTLNSVCKCRRAPNRITDLRNAGYSISTTIVRAADGSRIAQYQLISEP